MNKENLLQKIKQTYPQFENFRDISLIPNILSDKKKIMDNLIFRSSSLAKYKVNLISSFLKKKDIKWILDLRDEREFAMYEFDENLEYPNFFSNNFVRNIPMNPNISLELDDDDYFRELYHVILKKYIAQIKRVFEYIARAAEERVIIHCQAGVDRTGIITGLLLDLLGVKREYILTDYELSEHYSLDRSNLQFLFDVIDHEYGGIKNYLCDYCQISFKLLEQVKNQFLLSEKS